MNEGKNYKKELIRILIKAAIGAIIGVVFGAALDNALLMLFVGAGIPFGWKLISMIIPFNLVGFSVGALFFMVIKFGIAAIIGMFALPIMIVYYIVKIVMENKSVAV